MQTENKQVLQEFVRFLYDHNVQPIVVITPFSPEYNRFVLPCLSNGRKSLQCGTFCGKIPVDSVQGWTQGLVSARQIGPADERPGGTN